MKKLFLIIMVFAANAFGYFEISNGIPGIYTFDGSERWVLIAELGTAAESGVPLTNIDGIAFNDQHQTVVVGTFTTGTLQPGSAAFGYNAGYGNTRENQSVFGYQAGRDNTGIAQCAFGHGAGRENTGIVQSAFGATSGKYNTGNYQSAFGNASGYYNIGGYQTAIGYIAGYFNTGTYQSAFGYHAGLQNTGASQVALGRSAGQYNDGANNTAVGYDAFNSFSADAGSAVTFDFGNVSVGTNMVAIVGHGLGAVGTYLNLEFTEGDSELPGLTDGDIEIWKIEHANILELITDTITAQGTGDTHTLTPQYAYTNSTAVGYNAEPDASNQVMLGDTNVTEVKTYGSIAAPSATLGTLNIDNTAGTDAVITLDGTGANTGVITYESDNDLLIVDVDVQLGASLTVGTIINTGDGAEGAPAYSFTSDPDTGMYLTAGGEIRWTIDGSDVFYANSTDVGSLLPFRIPDGAAAFGGLNFILDSNTGLYRIGNDQLGIATAGNLRATFANSLTTLHYDLDVLGDTQLGDNVALDTIGINLAPDADMLIKGSFASAGSGGTFCYNNELLTHTEDDSTASTYIWGTYSQMQVNDDLTVNGTWTAAGDRQNVESNLTTITGSDNPIANLYGYFADVDWAASPLGNAGYSATVVGVKSEVTGNLGTVGNTTKLGVDAAVSESAVINYGGKFTATGGTYNYGVYGYSTGAHTTNYGLYGYAAGATDNYSLYLAAGPMRMAGTARVTNGIWIDAGGIKAPGLKPATIAAHGVLETPAWSFSDEALQASEQTVSWSTRIPNRMDRSVAPTITIGWSADASEAGVCEWQLEYLWTSPGEDTGAGPQETLYADGSAPVTADGLVVTTFTGIDVPSATDACLHCRLKRLSSATANGGEESDTITIAVHLHGTCFSFTSNKLGE